MVEMAQKGEKADVVIMDPPRTGSDEALFIIGCQAGAGESGVCVLWSGNTGEGFKVSHKAWICSEACNTI